MKINKIAAPLRLSAICLAAVLGGVLTSHATILDWQAEVGLGTTPTKTVFTTTAPGAQIAVNLGTLTGDRSFEFIVNSGGAGVSELLLVQQWGGEGLKFEQYNNTGKYGITQPSGGGDMASTVPITLNQDVDLLFVSTGTDTLLYENGVYKYTFTGVALTMTGTAYLAPNWDKIDGNILGFASYDSALSDTEVAAHYAALVVPEPSSVALAIVAGSLLFARFRRNLLLA